MQRLFRTSLRRTARLIVVAGVCAATLACETPGEVLSSPAEPEVIATQPPVFPLPVPRPPRPEVVARPAPEAPVADMRNKPRPAEHLVKSGEDIYQVAAMYGLDAYILATNNGLSPPFTVAAGQRLKLPPTDAQAAAAAAQAASAEAGSSAATAGEGEGSTTEPLHAGPPRPEGGSETAAAVPVPQSPVAPESVQEEGFIWPVSGEVISEFGPKGNGLFNDGINIAAARGAPVRAAESGVVAYAGNELRGFGNMLLIKHADGWVTAYAHVDDSLVNKGERVSKGQVIARVGSSGSVTSPQLHFEMRKGKKAVDPIRYLRRTTA